MQPKKNQQPSLLGRVTGNVLNRISVILFTIICIIDHSSRWVADMVYPRVLGVLEGSLEYRKTEEGYFHILFLFDSFKMFIISLLAYIIVNDRLKSNKFLVWLSFSWMTLNTSDLLDNLIGCQDDIGFLDFISLFVISFSLVKNVFYNEKCFF